MSRNRKLVNQSLELTVNQISVEGRGISSLDGKKVFVFGALENEKVQAKVQERGRHGQAINQHMLLFQMPSSRSIKIEWTRGREMKMILVIAYVF